jgi:hypothetical protein
MSKWWMALVVLMVCAAPPVAAQSVRSEVAASNGVIVTIHADEFANRYEYSAPAINFPDFGGFALVVRTRQSGIETPIRIVGAIMYRGEWRYYRTAIFRGGVPAAYTRVAGDVGSCSGSRYSRGCSLSEQYSIDLTPEEVTRHTQDGRLQIQVRAVQGDPVMIDIPVSYIDAVTEVSTP